MYAGRGSADAKLDSGWLLGHFKEIGELRHSEAVEIKWGEHPRGDRRSEWVSGDRRTAVMVLVSGRFRLEFPDRHVVLAEPGDYVVWGRGVDHSWYAPEASVVLTVRWPSIPGYQAAAESQESGDPADRCR